MRIVVNKLLIAGVLYLLITGAWSMVKDAEIEIRYNVKNKETYPLRSIGAVADENMWSKMDGLWDDYGDDAVKLAKKAIF